MASDPEDFDREADQLELDLLDALRAVAAFREAPEDVRCYLSPQMKKLAEDAARLVAEHEKDMR